MASAAVIGSIDETHRSDLRSWVESANVPGHDFPIQNLPFCVFTRAGSSDAPRPGIGIGDRVLDLRAAAEEGVLDGLPSRVVEAFGATELNALMSLGSVASTTVRAGVSRLLRDDTRAGERAARVGDRVLIPTSDAELTLPAAVGDYTDFYASLYHATNVGSMFRPDNPLLPNYKYVPIGYHGRASSLVVSGTPVRRPNGQTREDGSAPPAFGPSRRLDYELEVGAYVAAGNALGEPVPIADAAGRIFGLSLVNDWSARDIQAWEYQPLGPFLAKSFATSVSPWVVTVEALAPFRAPALTRSGDDPKPLPYLYDPTDQERGAFEITLEVLLSSERMRSEGHQPFLVSHGRFTDMYWTFAQILTHHTSNGCNLRPGDLIASGTVSGEAKESRGCLLERTWRGTEPLALPTGEARRFLEDGDEVILRAYCEREPFRRVGFGECRGLVLPAT